MERLFARKALLADGWAAQVRLVIDAGRIHSIDVDAEPEPDDVAGGIAIPGLANAHSHAFQRLLAGHTEDRSPAGKDNFWSWRSRMYALAGLVDADALRTIARQVYTEMVATGYTSVAEFHYLHNEPQAAEPTTAMAEAIAAAARESGIRLTYVPVLYERAGFDAAGPTPAQERFVLDVDAFVDHYEAVSALSDEHFVTAVGVHSLRAVTPAGLQRVADLARRDDVPMHIHIAEQQREVDDCLGALGARPVEWLLDNHDVDANWCLVHATHVDEQELRSLAHSGAVVCLCPSTEANLGDGLFPLQAYLEHGGEIAIGSDSHVSVNPFEELRWLEYGQRLVTQSRNVAAVRRAETGRTLFELAAAGGARAGGVDAGRLEVGAAADLVLLDDDSPMLAGHTTRSLLDALVFSGFTLPIDRVMVAGDWQVVDGLHAREEPHAKAYTALANHIEFDGSGL
jgi:formimidoylglutamate deiminase